MPQNRSLTPPSGKNATGIGSGVMIGDGVMLTAGHVWLEFDEKPTRGTRTLVGSTLYYDPRGYFASYGQAIIGLPSPLPTPGPDNTISGQYIEPGLVSKDMVFVKYSNSTVDDDDAGLVYYIDPEMMEQSSFGLTSGTTYKRWGAISGTRTVTTQITAGNGTLSWQALGSSSSQLQRGDSGGANYITFDGMEFIVGNNISTTLAGVNTASYLRENEFYIINHLLEKSPAKGSISGNVTDDEPTNMIVGTANSDGLISGTFRADIILARDGDEFIWDGDEKGDTAWADDRLFGGKGNDHFLAGNGNDLIHGGDHRDYGSGRASLESDGQDTISYDALVPRSSGDTGIEIRFVGATSPAAASWNFGAQTDRSHAVYMFDSIQNSPESLGIDTLISVENVNLTEADDTVRIDILNYDILAGGDGQGGVFAIDMKGNNPNTQSGDFIDAGNYSSGIKIDLGGTSMNVHKKSDAALGLTILNAERAKSGSGDDELIGNSKANSLESGNGADKLVGGAGSDYFDPGKGTNTIWGDNDGGGGGAPDDIDTVHYSDILGSVQITYGASGATANLSVNRDGETDELHDIEVIEINSGVVSFDITSLISPTEKLTIRNATTASPTLSATAVSLGIEVYLGGVGEQGFIGHRDPSVSGKIKLEGFTTDILATEFDDKITDLSSHEKLVMAGAGHDEITVGSGDALIFGGEGYDVIAGGDGNDVIVDANTELVAGHGGWGTDQGRIDAGAGDDKILVSLPKDMLDDSWSIDAPVYYIDPGEGDDQVNLDFFRSGVIYSYAAGDGDDVVTQLSDAEYEYHSTHNFDGLHIYQPTITIRLSGYDASDVSVAWSQDELYLISEDIPNRDSGNYWLQRGTVVVSFAGGGSITINDVYGIVNSFTPDWAELPSGQGHGEPWIGFDGVDGAISATIIPGTSARDSQSQIQTTFRGGSAPQSLLIGDQDVSLERGDHSYSGGAGHDRLTVSWDPSALLASMAGTTLTISDRWGFIGTTDVTDFDEIYVLAEGQSYTPAEFFDTFGNGGNADVRGTSGNDILIGDVGRDRLYGDDGDDTISGLAGSDILDGGAGADAMSGGRGDDIYYVDDIDDVVVELADEGKDSVHSSVDFELPDHVENLILAGTATTGTGNALNNQITGNEFGNILEGGLGNDRLSGGLGDDELDGGDGNDTLLGGDGADLLLGADGNNSLLGNDGEDELVGGLGDDSLFGGQGDDTLTGGDGNDLLDGGTGADMMAGGNGNDIYYVDDALDQVIEGADEGYDVVYSSVDFTLTDDIEELRMVYTGPWTSAYAGYASEAGSIIYGTEDFNSLVGNIGADKLYGLGGYDFITGGSGGDTLDGGANNDEIYGDDGDDIILGRSGSDWLQGGAGTDLIVGSGVATMADVGMRIGREGSDDESDEYDTAFYIGVRADFTITNLQNGWFKVENNVSAEPDIDYLVNIDQLWFSDPNDPESEGETFVFSPPTLVEELDHFALTEDTGFSIEIMDSWFVDPNGETLTYSVSLGGGIALPDWLEFDGQFLTGTPPADFNGAFQVTLTAGSMTGSVSTMMTLVFAAVNDAPDLVEAMGSIEVIEEEELEFAVPSLTFNDLDGDALTLTADLSDGSPLPNWLSFDGEALSGTVPIGFSADLEVRITASDGILSVADILTITLAPAARTMALNNSAIEEVSVLWPFQRETLVTGPRHIPRAIDQDGEVSWQENSNRLPRYSDLHTWSGPAVMEVVEASDGQIAPQSSISFAGEATDHRLAIMVQEMSVFGVQSAGEGFQSWQRETVRPVDFFA